MKGSIQNRNEFLHTISKQLGRNELKTELEKPKWNYQPQDEVLKGADKDDLVKVMKLQCKSIHTDFVITNKSDLLETVRHCVAKYGGGPVVAWRDSRFQEFGLAPLFAHIWQEENIEFYEWDPSKGEENIYAAERANIGMTISDITLAESGTAVLFSNKDKGRTVSFLPHASLIIIPKSTIVPRLTQAARWISEKVKNGEHIASCINFITGPSNSADIESKLVVGVHGPVKAAYIVVEDM